MTSIAAKLDFSEEDVDLMQSMLEELRQLRSALREEDILTEGEACALLKVSLTTLRTWRRDGWLPFFSEGKLVKFERKAILQAYKLKFGKVTHYEKMQTLELSSKRRFS